MLDQALVALRVDEAVRDDVVFAVQLAREQGVGEAGAGFLARCQALRWGCCWGLGRTGKGGVLVWLSVVGGR